MPVVTYARAPKKPWTRERALAVLERKRTTVLKKTFPQYERAINVLFDGLVEPGLVVFDRIEPHRETMQTMVWWRFKKDADREDCSDYHYGFYLSKGVIVPYPGAITSLKLAFEYPIDGVSDHQLLKSMKTALGLPVPAKLHRFT